MSMKWISMSVFLLAVVALGCTYVAFNKEDTVLDDAFRERVGGDYIQLSKGMVHYELTGPEEGELVVLVHGFSIPSYVWDPTFAYLKEAGFRVLRFDLYGRGYSDRPEADYGIDLYVNQLNELLNALQVKSPVKLVGLSMGGAVVTHFVSRFSRGAFQDRISRVVLIDPLIEMPNRPVLKLIKVPGLRALIGKIVVIPTISGSVAKAVYDPASFPDWKERVEPQMTLIGYSNAIVMTAVQLAGKNFKEEYETLGATKIPAQLFWGREDQTISFEDSKKVLNAIPNADFHVIEKAGHLPNYEHPDIVNPLIAEFLQ